MMDEMLKNFFAGLWRHWLCWKTVRQLSALSERGLKDIGLDRSEIGSIATDLTTKRDESRLRNIRCSRPIVANVKSEKFSTG